MVTGAVSCQLVDPPVTDVGALGTVRSSCTVPPAVIGDHGEVRPTPSVAWNRTTVDPVFTTGTEPLTVAGAVQVEPLFVEVSYW